MLRAPGTVYTTVPLIGPVGKIVAIGGDRLGIRTGRTYAGCCTAGKVASGVGVVKAGPRILAGREGVPTAVRSIRHDIGYVRVVGVAVGICEGSGIHTVRHHISGTSNAQ